MESKAIISLIVVSSNQKLRNPTEITKIVFFKNLQEKSPTF